MFNPLTIDLSFLIKLNWVFIYISPIFLGTSEPKNLQKSIMFQNLGT